MLCKDCNIDMVHSSILPWYFSHNSKLANVTYVVSCLLLLVGENKCIVRMFQRHWVTISRIRRFSQPDILTSTRCIFFWIGELYKLNGMPYFGIQIKWKIDISKIIKLTTSILLILKLIIVQKDIFLENFNLFSP